ncbi:DNA invertase Pin-like site-specific DNA recombinase [Staphylococcus epidermidis]
MITSLSIMNEVISNPLLDNFMRNLTIQILIMTSEQERNESKRRQAQGIRIVEEKNVYRYYILRMKKIYKNVLSIIEL